MNIGTAGLKFIASNEGMSYTPHPDPPGSRRCVIGHGHNYDPAIEHWTSITDAEAWTLLQRDVAIKVVPYLRLLPPNATQNQIDALGDFCFNAGGGALDELLSHGWKQVPAQLLRWDYAGGVVIPGLLARREKESSLFNTK